MEINIYDKIKGLCDENNISISQLEKELGFGSSTITKWKTRSPSSDNLCKIANKFNVSIDYLMGRTVSLQTSDDILKEKGILSIQRAMSKVPNNQKTKAMDLIGIMIEKVFTEEDD